VPSCCSRALERCAMSCQSRASRSATQGGAGGGLAGFRTRSALKQRPCSGRDDSPRVRGEGCHCLPRLPRADPRERRETLQRNVEVVAFGRPRGQGRDSRNLLPQPEEVSNTQPCSRLWVVEGVSKALRVALRRQDPPDVRTAVRADRLIPLALGPASGAKVRGHGGLCPLTLSSHSSRGHQPRSAVGGEPHRRGEDTKTCEQRRSGQRRFQRTTVTWATTSDPATTRRVRRYGDVNEDHEGSRT